MDNEAYESYERDESFSETEREWDEEELSGRHDPDEPTSEELAQDAPEPDPDAADREHRIYIAMTTLEKMTQGELEAVMYGLKPNVLRNILRAMPDHDD